MNAPRPPAVAHVGVTVPDVVAAVGFYSEALDLRLLVAPTEVLPEPRHTGEFCEAFFPGFRGMRVARMITSEGIGLELFEWIGPRNGTLTPSPARDHETPGYFHVAFVDPDVDGRAERIIAAGGKRRTSTWQVFPDRPYSACYCEDPFGNIIEIISHSEAKMHGDQR